MDAASSLALPDLGHRFGKEPARTPEEEELIVTMHSTWEKAREIGRTEGEIAGRTEGEIAGRTEGRAEGEIAGHARAVLTLLQARGIAVPDAARERVLAQKDLARLERWLVKAAAASSLAEVLDEPS